jgi:hypothetical protein
MVLPGCLAWWWLRSASPGRVQIAHGMTAVLLIAAGAVAWASPGIQGLMLASALQSAAWSLSVAWARQDSAAGMLGATWQGWSWPAWPAATPALAPALLTALAAAALLALGLAVELHGATVLVALHVAASVAMVLSIAQRFRNASMPSATAP